MHGLKAISLCLFTILMYLLLDEINGSAGANLKVTWKTFLTMER